MLTDPTPTETADLAGALAELRTAAAQQSAALDQEGVRLDRAMDAYLDRLPRRRSAG